MNKFVEETIFNGRLPVFSKQTDKHCYVWTPGRELVEVCEGKDKFMVPYYRVKKDEPKAWLDKLILTPPNPFKLYEGILLSYFDQDGGEPRFGAAIYAIN